jgi:hypothetical protein
LEWTTPVQGYSTTDIEEDSKKKLEHSSTSIQAKREVDQESAPVPVPLCPCVGQTIRQEVM